MNLFRSEEHVARWLGGREGEGASVAGEAGDAQPKAGATIPVAKLVDLAFAWWRDRLDPDWRPHTRGQNQAILDGLGLTGPFWQLP